MSDEPRKVDFGSFKLPEPPSDTKAFEEYREGTEQYRTEVRGYLNKGGGWPTTVRRFGIVQLKDEES